MSATTLAAFIARCRVLCLPRVPVPDSELLRRFMDERDTEAFAQLLERYASLVWGVCRRIVLREADCEDAFQAVFLALVRRPQAVDPKQSLGAWLHTVAVRVARRIGERSRPLQLVPVIPEQATAGDVADDVSSRELCRIVDEEIEYLPISLRAPLILCCLEGRTRDEAAEALGCSVAAVKSRLERGRNMLRRRLQRRGVELPAAFLVLGLTSERIRAALWGKTMQTVLHTPAPALVALSDSGAATMLAGKYKLLVEMILLASTAAGTIGSLLAMKTQNPKPAAKVQSAVEPKKPPAPQVRTDRHGDPLPAGAVARLGTVRWRHGDFVHGLAYSPDGRMIATTGVGRALVLWDAASGKELRVFPSRGQPRGLAFSPDGKTIATTQLRGQLWDVATGKVLRELKFRPTIVNALAFFPDGKTLVTAESDGTVRLWDASKGEEKRRIESGQSTLLTLAIAPDGKLLASGGSDGTIRLWDAATSKEIRRITAPKKEIASVVFSPDGKMLASGSNEDTPRLWDVKTGEQIRTLNRKQGSFAPLAFSPDGKLLASGHGEGTLSLWDVSSGEEKRHWPAGTVNPRNLAFSPDGKTLASAVIWDGGLRLWDVTTGRDRFAAEGHHGPIPLLRFDADKNTLISGGFDRRLLWWDVKTQKPQRRLVWTIGRFNPFALSPDSNILAVDDHDANEVWLWDVRTGKPTKLPGKHKNWIADIAFSLDGRLVASGGRDGGIHVWDVRERKEFRQIKSDVNAVEILSFSPDSSALAFGANNLGMLFSNKPTLHLWDLASGKERCSFNNHTHVAKLAFSPDGKVLASADGYLGGQAEPLVRLWDTTSGEELCRHHGHRTGIAAVAFSPDGKLVASGGGDDDDNSVQVWEAATGRLIRRFEGHHSWVWAVTFAADGLTVASGAGDSTILLWDITGGLLSEPRTKRSGVSGFQSAALTPRDLDACWTALADQDATKAYDTVWKLIAAPEQAVPFLGKHLTPIPIPDAKLVAQRIAELDSEDFATRQHAAEELSRLGDAIIPALERTLDAKPSLEVRRRVQQLLDQARDGTAERLRDHRAIQALEHIGTKSSKEVLQRLAAGASDTLRTEEAKAALRRRSGPRP